MSSLALNIGDTETLTVSASYSDGTSATATATWTSSNASVASIGATGVVTAHAGGTTTITATFEGQSDVAVVTVTAAGTTVTGLSVSASATSVVVGGTATVMATASYSDGTSATVTPTWSSSNAVVATVSSSGTVTAVAAGTATITGTFEGQSGSVEVTVTAADATVTSLAVTAAATSLEVGQTTTVTATATYSDGTSGTVNPNRVVWLSSDESLATVSDDGTVAGVAAGTVAITGTFEGQSDSVSITVEAAEVTVTGLEVNASATTMSVGATVTVTGTAAYSDDTTATVTPTWSSSDTDVATVSSSGTVTAVAAGTTTITGTAENRCSPYDSGDYSYPQSVEDAIIDRLGGIYSPYTGECFAGKSETDIEHMVARSEAHDSGLCAADGGTRRSFSQDLDNLTLASPAVNRNQKGAKDAADWLPARNSCWFAATIIEVRRRYGLTIDQREADALDQVLASCTSTELEPSDCDGGTESGIGVVINEFRTRGPMGANDEFIELRNNSSANVNIGGWQVVGSNSSGATSVRRNIPSGIVLGVGCHYLLGNSNTNGYAGSTDTTYGVGITDTGGIALRKSDGTVMDQVGLSSGSAFQEGSPLPGFPSGNTNHSYSRADADTNDNLADFLLISPSTPQTVASPCVQ